MIAPMEAWQSGLMHRSWKPTRVWVLREFESHRFRQIIFKYKLKLINNPSLSWAITASSVWNSTYNVSDQILKKQSGLLLLLFLFKVFNLLL